MKIEVTKETNKYCIYYDELTIEINGKEIIMDVSVCNSNIEDSIESNKTNIWNTLESEEKFAIKDAIEEHYK